MVAMTFTPQGIQRQENPLKAFMRTPKIYVKLPSNGKFYPASTTLTNEIPVKAMTAKDEALLKNPDALLNGDAVENMIASCVPALNQPRELVLPDVDTLLLAIRYASYGDKLDCTVKCPQCEQITEFQHSIRHLLDIITLIPEDNFVSVETENARLDIFVKPYTYQDSTNANLMTYEQARMVDMISKATNISEEMQRKQINEAFTKLNDFSYQTNIGSCYQINIVQKDNDGNDMINSITDKDFIKEYFAEMDKTTYTKVSEKIAQLNKAGINKEFLAVCSNEACKHQWTTEIAFDPSSFFTSDS